jgi:hypothetical protein
MRTSPSRASPVGCVPGQESDLPEEATIKPGARGEELVGAPRAGLKEDRPSLTCS